MTERTVRVHKLALRQVRHECANNEIINRTNCIIEPSSTPAAEPSSNLLLLLMIRKMEIQFRGAMNCISNPSPHCYRQIEGMPHEKS